MTKFYGMKTCTTNLKEYLPDQYHSITHKTIAEMLDNEGYIYEINTIQISTCHRFASLCFDTTETLLTFTNTEHLILPNISITFQLDYYEKKRISIENLPTRLPDKQVKTFLSQYTTLFGKTYYPGTKHQNKYYTTGTRVYQYIDLKEHIPKHIYYFGRYLHICYDDHEDMRTNLLQTPIPPILTKPLIHLNYHETKHIFNKKRRPHRFNKSIKTTFTRHTHQNHQNHQNHQTTKTTFTRHAQLYTATTR